MNREAAVCNDTYIPTEITVVLIDTRNPLNIGSAARALANFGVTDLRLVNPYDVAFREAVSAVGGAPVLKAARVFDTLGEALADCALVVGTTAGQRRIAQHPVDRLEAGMARVRGFEGRVALLFGSEKFGLSNEDLSFCHSLIRIPTVPDTPSMNLGQAVAVCLFEFIRDAGTPPVHSASELPDGGDVEQITSLLKDVLVESGFTNKTTSTSTNEKVRRWVRRLRISRRDAPLVLGILRQILWKFRKQ